MLAFDRSELICCRMSIWRFLLTIKSSYCLTVPVCSRWRPCGHCSPTHTRAFLNKTRVRDEWSNNIVSELISVDWFECRKKFSSALFSDSYLLLQWTPGFPVEILNSLVFFRTRDPQCDGNNCSVNYCLQFVLPGKCQFMKVYFNRY